MSGAPAWWPPKVGDRLRTRHCVETGWIDRLCHVLAVFEHNGQALASIGWYGTHKRWWHYEVIRPLDAALTRARSPSPCLKSPPGGEPRHN